MTESRNQTRIDLLSSDPITIFDGMSGARIPGEYSRFEGTSDGTCFWSALFIALNIEKQPYLAENLEFTEMENFIAKGLRGWIRAIVQQIIQFIESDPCKLALCVKKYVRDELGEEVMSTNPRGYDDFMRRLDELIPENCTPEILSRLSSSETYSGYLDQFLEYLKGLYTPDENGEFTYTNPQFGIGQSFADYKKTNLCIVTRDRRDGRYLTGQSYFVGGNKNNQFPTVYLFNTGGDHYQSLIPYDEVRRRSASAISSVNHFKNFGYSESQIFEALRKADNNIERAAVYLENPGESDSENSGKIKGRKRDDPIMYNLTQEEGSKSARPNVEEEDLDSAIAQLMSKYSKWKTEKIRDNLNKLREYGYTIEQSMNALDMAGTNDFGEALEILLSLGGKRRSLKRKRSTKPVHKTHKNYLFKRKITRKRRITRYSVRRKK